MFKSKSKDPAKGKDSKPKQTTGNGSTVQSTPPNVPTESAAARPKLMFHCQQAHGSPTGVISEFTNVKELYQKIAECYDLKANQVIDSYIYGCSFFPLHYQFAFNNINIIIIISTVFKTIK